MLQFPWFMWLPSVNASLHSYNVLWSANDRGSTWKHLWNSLEPIKSGISVELKEDLFESHENLLIRNQIRLFCSTAIMDRIWSLDWNSMNTRQTVGWSIPLLIVFEKVGRGHYGLHLIHVIMQIEGQLRSHVLWYPPCQNEDHRQIVVLWILFPSGTNKAYI